MLRVDSSIEKVTVYHQGATVHRRLEVEAAGGKMPGEISVPGLPLALADASVRVTVVSTEGGSDLIVSGLRVGLHVAKKADLTESADAVAIQSVTRQIEKRRAEQEDLERESAVLDSMRVPERPEPEEGKPPPPSPLGARVMLEELVDEGRKKRRERGRELRDEIETLDKKLRELTARRDEASDARQIKAEEITKTVVLTLGNADGVLRAVLRLDYYVEGARWAPAYQVRLARDASEADIVQRALVCQRTGEDWRGVRLSLSTASPMSWTELPELSAIRIGKRQTPPPAKRGFRPPPPGASQLYGDYDMARLEAGRMVPREASFPPISISIGPPLAGGRFGGQDDDATGAGYMAQSLGVAAMREMDDFDEMMAEEEAAPEPQMAPTRARKASAAFRSAPPMAPPPAKKKMVAPSRRPSRVGGGGLPSSVAEAVVYTQLVLGSPSDPQARGRLTPIDERTAYLSTLDTGDRILSVDVMDVVQRATARAQSALQTDLPRGAVDVRRVSGSFDYAYVADAAVDVASDGVFHSVPLGSRKSSCDVRYVVVPREDPNVFRIAQIENPLYAPLLAGPAEIYVGGEYVLTTTLETVAPRGRLTLGLGVEQAVRCARNARFTEKRTSDKVVATNELCHDLTVQIVNNLPRTIQCEVRERIPQPDRDAEVVVEETGVTPAWETYDQVERGVLIDGGRRWNVSVAAGASVDLAARYVVKIYANNEIVGGNRREA